MRMEAQLCLEKARETFSTAKDWVIFFREVLGVEGIVRKTFPIVAERLAFESSAEYRQILTMLGELRLRSGDGRTYEPVQVITIRIPQSLHSSLTDEAHDLKTSVNKLCISKLLQSVEHALVLPNKRNKPATTVEVDSPAAP